MKILVVTNMYPTQQQPHFGIFVQEQVESLRRQGVEIDVLFVNGRQNKLNYLLGYPRLWWQLRKKKYDLIHAHYIFSGLVARGQIGVPVVLTHHGPEVFQSWESRLCRLFTRFFDSVIVVSKEMKQRLPYEAATVIPCGIDMQRFRPVSQAETRKALGLPLARKLVLWAGEPQRPEKRHDLVQAAFAALQAGRDDVDLITLSGKTHDVVPVHMNAADVLLLTSDAEGSPMVIKEAMACNLPIVSTAVGDVREVLGDTPGCYICSQDPSEIAERLSEALDFGTRTRGRSRVRSMDLDVISLRILFVYSETLAGRKRHRRIGMGLPGRQEVGPR